VPAEVVVTEAPAGTGAETVGAGVFCAGTGVAATTVWIFGTTGAGVGVADFGTTTFGDTAYLTIVGATFTGALFVTDFTVPTEESVPVTSDAATCSAPKLLNALTNTKLKINTENTMKIFLCMRRIIQTSKNIPIPFLISFKIHIHDDFFILQQQHFSPFMNSTKFFQK
jgi:hypothetical protein